MRAEEEQEEREEVEGAEDTAVPVLLAALEYLV